MQLNPPAMKTPATVTIQTADGLKLQVPLENYGEREAATIFIDGVPHHLERMPGELLQQKYRIDADPDYVPMTDLSKHCVMVSPFSQK